jgi:asparagine synthase (glutamine-hydrolysing)
MCGIAGIYAPDHFGTLATDIQRMTARLTHRGPDDEGYYVGEKVALGHRRLSIIDLQGGHQPIFNEDGSCCIVFNGEIFNYLEIKRLLETKGHRFITNSDTETILHAYEEWGEECLEKFRGMFAFCICNLRDETIFLARDRFGIKPLFYAQYHGKFVFSSEIKSILLDPEFRRTINSEALAAYFMFGYIPAPLTIFNNIAKLLPGHTLTLKNGEISVKKYWDLEFRPDRQKSEKDFIAEYMDLLKEAVRLRLLSEVPLGAFLSGGIDSSTVVALMSGESSLPVNTFTIGFGGDTRGFDDERKYARLVAGRYGTNHKECEVAPDVEGAIDGIVEAFDEPFADDGALPSYFVCELARKHVTVALSGLGGDEAFCGYERYLGFRLSGMYNVMPRSIRDGVIAPIVARMPESRNGGNMINHIKRFVRASSCNDGERYLGYVSKVDPLLWGPLFSESGKAVMDATAACRERFLAYFATDNAEDPLNKVLYCDIKTYLPDDILACTDRTSMHHSLEVRVPFLDHQLMEYCATIPPELKIKWLEKKYLLKRAVSSLLPEPVIRHKKQGFVGPMARWLRTDLRKFTLNKLSDRALRKHDWVNPRTIKKVVDDHQSGRQVHDSLIWSLLVFQAWFDRYMD